MIPKLFAKHFKTIMSRCVVPLCFTLCLYSFTACKQNPMPAESFGIVSLSPSITRQLVDLNAEDLLVGVTTLHPPLTRQVEIIGSLVVPNFEKILRLRPSLVLFSEEDSHTQKLDPLKSSGLTLYGFGRNNNFEAICKNYIELGRIINKQLEAESKVAAYKKELIAAKTKPVGISVLMLVSWKPLISVSNDSFIGHIINDAGGKNIFHDTVSSYPLISPEAVALRDPDAVIIMTEGDGSGFTELFRSFSLRAIKNNNVFTIDPEHIAYYTPRDYIVAVNEIVKIISNATQGKEH